MKKPYFIMAFSQNGELAIPIIDSDSNENDVKLFKTFKEAKDCANIQPICQAFGYKIFKMV
jgi:hypothetical protein